MNAVAGVFIILRGSDRRPRKKKGLANPHPQQMLLKFFSR